MATLTTGVAPICFRVSIGPCPFPTSRWGEKPPYSRTGVSNRGYEDLLDRARERIPKDISERSRWTMPQPDIMIEGSQTILRNFSEIVDAMDRDANHVFQYLLNELGTSGSREQVRIMLKGKVPPKRIKEKIVSYVKTYILCGECKAPDTRFMREDRTTLLKCQACGATRPVRL